METLIKKCQWQGEISCSRGKDRWRDEGKMFKTGGKKKKERYKMSDYYHVIYVLMYITKWQFVLQTLKLLKNLCAASGPVE